MGPEYALILGYGNGYAIYQINRSTEARLYVDMPPVKESQYSTPYMNLGGWVEKTKPVATSASVDELVALVARHVDYMAKHEQFSKRHRQELLELSRTFNPFHKERKP
jgi:hypothetical protein